MGKIKIIFITLILGSHRPTHSSAWESLAPSRCLSSEEFVSSQNTVVKVKTKIPKISYFILIKNEENNDVQIPQEKAQPIGIFV